MAFATLTLVKCTGLVTSGVFASETEVPDDIVAFLNADITSIEVDLYPVAVPANAAASPNYSYEMWLKWKLDEEPDNYIQNLKVYGPSTQPDYPNTQVTVMIGTTSAGVAPIDSASTVATVSQHDNYNSPDDYLSLAVEPVDNILDTAGEETELLVVQLKVEDTASQNQVGVMTYILAYEEI